MATEFEPDLFLKSNDPRLKILFAVTQHLDGVLFTPSGLWDSSGRALLCADGRSDLNAVIPGIAPGISRPSKKISEQSVDREQTPPDAERVAKRALCLAGVSGRAFIEMEKMPPEQAESLRSRLLSWVGELDLEKEFEPSELHLLEQPVSSLQRQAMVDAGWRLEGLGVLAWALNRFELPAYDKLIDAGGLFPAVGFLDLNQATSVLASPVLRSSADLRRGLRALPRKLLAIRA